MTENVAMVRVAAVDLAGLIDEMETLRYQLRQTERLASETAVQGRDESNELLEQFNGFRRAVQEALGYDQPELFTDTVLVEHVRMFRQRLAGVTAASLFESGAQVVVPMGGPFPGFSVTGEEAMANAAANTAAIAAAAQRAIPDDVDDRLTYAKMIERDPITLADGTQARFFSDARPEDGPPTESMPPVEEPPEIEGFRIGRVFTRGDSFPEGITGWWGVADRSGDVHVLTHFDSDGSAVMTREDADRTAWSTQWSGLLHMHGTVWEVLPLTREAQDGADPAWVESAGEQVSGE